MSKKTKYEVECTKRIRFFIGFFFCWPFYGTDRFL